MSGFPSTFAEQPLNAPCPGSNPRLRRGCMFQLGRVGEAFHAEGQGSFWSCQGRKVLPGLWHPDEGLQSDRAAEQKPPNPGSSPLATGLGKGRQEHDPVRGL